MHNKQQVKIILCRTWSPGNVGSVVRAMKNFGFSELICCNQINIDQTETKTMAAGASDMVEKIKFAKDLSHEVSKCQVVYAFTGRQRKHYQILTPREMAIEISNLPADCQVALLFGNETNGLNNEELDLADKIVMIPAEPDYPSLNLAQSVMLAVYEMQISLKLDRGESAELIIPHAEKEFMATEIILAVQKIVNKEVNNPQIAENIRHFFKKSRITAKESRFIHSLFRLILRKLGAIL